MSKTISKAALLAAVLAGVGGSASAACRDDLVATAQKLQVARANVDGATTPAAKCAASRQHVAALTRVRSVFARCDTGADKAKNAAQVGGSIAALNKQIRESCKN